MRDRDVVRIVRLDLAHEADLLAVLQDARAAGQDAEADFGALQIDQDADRPACLGLLRRIVRCSSASMACEVWLMLMRKTSTPASNRARIFSGLDEAGPSVATILVLRRRLMRQSESVWVKS